MLLLLHAGLVQKCFFVGRGWSGRLFEGGRLLTFRALRVGANNFEVGAFSKVGG